MQQTLADARNRVKDSHRLQMKAIGGEATEGDDVGISVQGDTHVHIQGALDKGTDLMKKFLIGAAIAVGGTGLGFLACKLLSPQQPTPAQGAIDSEYEVRFYDRDGNPIKVPHISERGK